MSTKPNNSISNWLRQHPASRPVRHGLLQRLGARLFAPRNPLAGHPWISRAKLVFGTTHDPREAGYLTPDGTFLDFSGKRQGGHRGARSYDHGDIWQAMGEQGGGTTGMLRFMGDTGSIRWSLIGDSLMLDVAQEPTAAQLREIADYGAGNEVTIDITDTLSGHTLRTLEIDNAKPVTIRNKLKQVFVEPWPRSANPGTLPIKRPWEMTRAELETEKRALKAKLDAEYWTFSRSHNAPFTSRPADFSRLADVNAALATLGGHGEKALWQYTKQAALGASGVPAAAHRRMVEKALSEGKPVPAEVLADYPDLAPAHSQNPRFYHGTGSAFDKPDAARFDAEALYGPGYYLTSSPDVAGGYATQRGELLALNEDVLRNEERNLRMARAALASKLPQEGRARWEQALRQAESSRDRLMAEMKQGPNLQAVDVPEGLRLFDAEARYDKAQTEQLAANLPESTGHILRNGLGYFRQKRHGAPTGDDLYQLIGETLHHNRQWTLGSDDKKEVNTLLAGAGYDGIKYAGGKRVPRLDEHGRPIKHDALVIFPESLGKLRGSYSRKPLANPTFRKIDPRRFVEGRSKSPRPWFLTPYSVPELRHFERVAGSPDARVGYALKRTDEGTLDLVNVYNAGGPKGAGRQAALDGVVHGAETLDAIGGFLEEYYESLGFRTYKREPWADEYAPENWPYTTEGRPDILYMRYTGGPSGRKEAARTLLLLQGAESRASNPGHAGAAGDSRALRGESTAEVRPGLARREYGQTQRRVGVRQDSPLVANPPQVPSPSRNPKVYWPADFHIGDDIWAIQPVPTDPPLPMGTHAVILDFPGKWGKGGRFHIRLDDGSEIKKVDYYYWMPRHPRGTIWQDWSRRLLHPSAELSHEPYQYPGPHGDVLFTRYEDSPEKAERARWAGGAPKEYSEQREYLGPGLRARMNNPSATPWVEYPTPEGAAREAESRGNHLVYRMIHRPEEVEALKAAIDEGRPAEGFLAAALRGGHQRTVKNREIDKAEKRGAVPVFTTPYPTVAVQYENWADEAAAKVEETRAVLAAFTGGKFQPKRGAAKQGAGMFVAIEYDPHRKAGAEGLIHESSTLRGASSSNAAYFCDSEEVIDARSIKRVSFLSPEQLDRVYEHLEGFECGMRRGLFGNVSDKDAELAAANAERVRNLEKRVTTLGRTFIEAPAKIAIGEIKKGDRVVLASGVVTTVTGYRPMGRNEYIQDETQQQEFLAQQAERYPGATARLVVQSGPLKAKAHDLGLEHAYVAGLEEMNVPDSLVLRVLKPGERITKQEVAALAAKARPQFEFYLRQAIEGAKHWKAQAEDTVAHPERLKEYGREVEIKRHQETVAIMAERIAKIERVLAERLANPTHPWVEAAVQHFGTTEEAAGARYLTPEGQLLPVGRRGHESIDEVVRGKWTGARGLPLARHFMRTTGSARWRYEPATQTLMVELAHAPTPQQVAAITDYGTGSVLFMDIYDPESGRNLSNIMLNDPRKAEVRAALREVTARLSEHPNPRRLQRATPGRRKRNPETDWTPLLMVGGAGVLAWYLWAHRQQAPEFAAPGGA